MEPGSHEFDQRRCECRAQHNGEKVVSKCGSLTHDEQIARVLVAVGKPGAIKSSRGIDDLFYAETELFVS